MHADADRENSDARARYIHKNLVAVLLRTWTYQLQIDNPDLVGEADANGQQGGSYVLRRGGRKSHECTIARLDCPHEILVVLAFGIVTVYKGSYRRCEMLELERGFVVTVADIEGAIVPCLHQPLFSNLRVSI
jgi:hypothetical protein